MTAEEFCTWLDDMREAGGAKTDKEAARQLGFHPKRVAQMKHEGTAKRQTDELCRILLEDARSDVSGLRRLAAKHGFKLVPL